MPIHDWTRASAGGFHNFHQDWTIEIYRALNRGLLPPGFTAYTDLRAAGWEPDVVTIQAPRRGDASPTTLLATPPSSRQVARIESDATAYARKANRIAIRHEFGQLVAIIEVISPGNKDSRQAIGSFLAKAIDFLGNGVNLLVIDLFPPSPRDPGGLHALIWDQLSRIPFEARPADKPLTVASFETGEGITAYVDPLAVGDLLPDAPLFLGPGSYVNVPLEQTYQAAWEVTPGTIRDLVAPGDSEAAGRPVS
ncbi:MAG: DUF4058 family protein [Isosphaeraceae bacterium]